MVGDQCNSTSKNQIIPRNIGFGIGKNSISAFDAGRPKNIVYFAVDVDKKCFKKTFNWLSKSLKVKNQLPIKSLTRTFYQQIHDFGTQ